VVPAACLREEVRALAVRIAQASPVTLAIGKQAYCTRIDLDQPKAYACAEEIMTLDGGPMPSKASPLSSKSVRRAGLGQ
jgi:hypothetical protein